jgi:hypothetical protein
MGVPPLASSVPASTTPRAGARPPPCLPQPLRRTGGRRALRPPLPASSVPGPSPRPCRRPRAVATGFQGHAWPSSPPSSIPRDSWTRASPLLRGDRFLPPRQDSRLGVLGPSLGAGATLGGRLHGHGRTKKAALPALVRLAQALFRQALRHSGPPGGGRALGPRPGQPPGAQGLGPGRWCGRRTLAHGPRPPGGRRSGCPKRGPRSRDAQEPAAMRLGALRMRG